MVLFPIPVLGVGQTHTLGKSPSVASSRLLSFLFNGADHRWSDVGVEMRRDPPAYVQSVGPTLP